MEVLNDDLPKDLQAEPPLPGVQPLTHGKWLHVDEAYAGQMAYRETLISKRLSDVHWMEDEARDAACETLAEALILLPEMGFDVGRKFVTCPDGREVVLESDPPLVTLGRLIQEDVCILRKVGDEHVLVGAVLCFPANWTLREKAGRPLTRIHRPVPEYDAAIAKRVQRLFDGVQTGRPLWRNNMLRYEDADLYQPRLEDGPDRELTGRGNFIRAERQCILRLPISRDVIFSIHSYVVRASET
ncbi:MAG: DUF3445 domain-containing protein [Pseudomonadota bacterium]